jgi:hypothetical protein
MVVTKFLHHKDNCELPAEDEFVRVKGRIGIVVESRVGTGKYPVFEVQLPSGRMNSFSASEVTRLPDQKEGRKRFYE